jgi:hypothetical protein
MKLCFLLWCLPWRAGGVPLLILSVQVAHIMKVIQHERLRTVPERKIEVQRRHLKTSLLELNFGYFQNINRDIKLITILKSLSTAL